MGNSANAMMALLLHGSIGMREVHGSGKSKKCISQVHMRADSERTYHVYHISHVLYLYSVIIECFWSKEDERLYGSVNPHL